MGRWVRIKRRKSTRRKRRRKRLILPTVIQIQTMIGSTRVTRDGLIAETEIGLIVETEEAEIGLVAEKIEDIKETQAEIDIEGDLEVMKEESVEDLNYIRI